MKKYFVLAVFVIFAGFACFSQNASLTAKSLIDNAAKKTSLTDSISYLKKNIPSVSVNSEKRAACAFLAAVLEQQGQYSEAQKYYVQAASLQGSSVQNVSGVPNKNSEQLVLDAVRCALCAGDYSSAETYLNSSVRNSKDENVLAFVKLYEQWASLCKAKNENETKESIALLKTYATLDSMKTVRSSILLTLWHLTGESQYSESLKKNYPKSMETAIVKGEIQTLPTPFWYFVPRNGVDLPEIAAVQNSEPSSKTEPKKSEEAKTSSKNDKIVKQQLGLFREEANAKALVQRLSEKGFKAEIATEVRPSGTKYYIVVVNENAKGTVGEELRTAGFECYPVFE